MLTELCVWPVAVGDLNPGLWYRVTVQAKGQSRRGLICPGGVQYFATKGKIKDTQPGATQPSVIVSDVFDLV